MTTLYQVDAFTREVFGGNPAAVVPLDQWRADRWLQQVAAENNLSETVFIVPKGTDYEIRWFTPKIEVDLCGHATLAAAHVLFEELNVQTDELRFHSNSGLLTAVRQDGTIRLDFPRVDATKSVDAAPFSAALGSPAEAAYQARYTMVVYPAHNDIEALSPDFSAITRCDTFGIIATAPGRDCDFVSRFFAPRAGIPEDSVTGSAHCTLVPYWANRLGKTTFHARQLSPRGGELFCALMSERVEIGGHAVTYLRGTIRE